MFWPVTLALAIAFSALVVTGVIDTVPAETQFVMALVLCTTAAAISLYRSHVRTGRLHVQPLLWAVMALVISGAYSFREHGRLFALSLLEQPVEIEPNVPSLRNEVMLMRAWDGHFRAVADVNDTPVGLLIDTGASLVLIRYDDARRIGMPDTDLDFNMAVTTANGRSFVAPVTFDEISIGGVVVRDVEGAVARPGQLHSSLLGMSFIERLDEVAIRRDRIVLRN